jgi:hypothetical protein
MRLLSVVLLVLLFQVSVCAQSAAGTLVGTVIDPSGLPIAGASVVVTEIDTNYSRSGTTSDKGVYSIPNLKPANYQLEFQKDQFKTVRVAIELPANETRRIDMPMSVGTINEVVNVQAEASQLQTDTSSISGVVDGGQVLRLPSNGRQIESYIQLLVGASISAPGSHLSNRGGMNIDGVDEHYQSFFLDGFDNVDPVIRNFSLRPSLDGVQELRVEQSGYAAEFGRNAGAVVNVITKSGTNDWHGSLWEFLRNDNLDARNFFARPGQAKPVLIRNQFGATIGGPLKRDKTFLFAWYEGLRQKVGQVRRATVPTDKMRTGDLSEIGGPVLSPSQINAIALDAMQAFPRPNLPGTLLNRIEVANRIEKDNNFSARVDHALTTSTRLMGRYSGSVAHVIDPFRTETSGAVNLSNFGQTADRFKTNVGISVVSVIGNSLVHEFRAGFNRFRQPQTPLNQGTAALQPLMGTLKTFPMFSIAGYDPLGSGPEFRRADNVYNYVDNLSYVRGNHQFKFGVDARRYLFNGYNVPPNIFAFSGARTGQPINDFLQGLPTVAIAFEGSPNGNTRKFEFAAYAQDDWKIAPRFTLNYGLRWEFYGRMTERVNKQAFWVPECNCMQRAGIETRPGLVDGDYNNFAPRLGFAWRPFREKIVVRVSSGIFFDNDQRHNTEVFANPPFFASREYFFPPSLSAPFSSGSTSTLQPQTFERHFRDTYVEQWSLNVQYQIAEDLLASVSYVGNHSVKGRRLRNVNQPLPGTSAAPYPGFARIALFEQAGSSNYNAFQFHLDRRFSRGLAFTSSYTWGHAIDDRPGQGAGLSQDYYNMRAERGDSDFDVRHTWVASGTYELPLGTGRPWGGWSINAISTTQSGRPFTVTTSLPTATFSGQRPDVVPGTNWRPSNQGPDLWIDPNAFRSPAGPFGTLGRNTLRGPGVYNLDVSLIKTHRLETASLEMRAEFFNVLNHPNFGLPNAVLGPTLGTISATSVPERQIQLGVKLTF